MSLLKYYLWTMKRGVWTRPENLDKDVKRNEIPVEYNVTVLKNHITFTLKIYSFINEFVLNMADYYFSDEVQLAMINEQTTREKCSAIANCYIDKLDKNKNWIVNVGKWYSLKSTVGERVCCFEVDSLTVSIYQV